jgi:hypothetical protein
MIGAKMKAAFGSVFKNVRTQLALTQSKIAEAGAAWGKVAGDFSKVALGFTGAAAAVGLGTWKAVDSIAAVGDSAAKTAAKLKMSAEDYQELQYAFGLAGAEGDMLDGMLTKLNTTLTNTALNTKKADEWSKAYGLDANKLANMDAADRIGYIADELNKIQDPLKKDKVAIELFGKKASQMEAILAMGSSGLASARAEAVRTGNVISNTAAHMGENYDDAKAQLIATFSGLKVQFFSPMLEGFTNLALNIASTLQESMPQITELGSQIGSKFTELASQFSADITPKIADFMSNFIENLPTIVTNMGELLTKALDLASTIINVANATADFFGGWENLSKIVLGFMALKPVLNIFTAIFKSGSALISIFKLAWAVLSPIFGAIVSFVVANPISLAIAAAVAAIIGAVYLIIKYWKQIKAFFIAVGKGIATSFIDIWNGTVKFLKGIWEGMKAGFSNLWNGIKQKFSDMITAIKTTFSNFKNWIKINIIDKITGFFTDIKTGIINAFSGAWDKVKETAGAFKNSILNLLDPILSFFDDVKNKILGIFQKKYTLNMTTYEVMEDGSVFAGRVGSRPATRSKHALGGIFYTPHIAQIAEAGTPEAVIPLENSDRARSLWESAGRLAGFNSNSQTSNFNINVSIPINGSASEQTVRDLRNESENLARMIQRLVNQTLHDREVQKMRLSF